MCVFTFKSQDTRTRTQDCNRAAARWRACFGTTPGELCSAGEGLASSLHFVPFLARLPAGNDGYPTPSLFLISRLNTQYSILKSHISNLTSHISNLTSAPAHTLLSVHPHLSQPSVSIAGTSVVVVVHSPADHLPALPAYLLLPCL